MIGLTLDAENFPQSRTLWMCTYRIKIFLKFCWRQQNSIFPFTFKISFKITLCSFSRCFSIHEIDEQGEIESRSERRGSYYSILESLILTSSCRDFEDVWRASKMFWEISIEFSSINIALSNIFKAFHTSSKSLPPCVKPSTFAKKSLCHHTNLTMSKSRFPKYYNRNRVFQIYLRFLLAHLYINTRTLCVHAQIVKKMNSSKLVTIIKGLSIVEYLLAISQGIQYQSSIYRLFMSFICSNCTWANLPLLHESGSS